MSIQSQSASSSMMNMPTAHSEPEFTSAAPDQLIEQVAAALRTNNIDAIIVDTGDEARRQVLELIPEGAEVHSGKSKTLEDIGLIAELNESGRFDAVRPRLMKMDRKTQGVEMRKLGAAPNFMLGSVQAVTEKGVLVAVSAGGGQLGPYASGAGRLILVIGSQKIVPDLDEAMRRVREHVFPYEDARLKAQYGINTVIGKVLVIHQEFTPGRTTVILVKEPVGV